MNKYLLVGLCLLAFVAGSAAQLALHRSGGDATPAPTETIAAAPAQPENNPPAARPAEPQAEQAAPEASVEKAVIEEVQGPEAAEVAEGGDVSRGAVRASRRAGAVRSRANLRATRTISRPGSAPAPSRVASRDDGVHEKAASGAKKTGRWLGKGLKKLGGVFHD
jgi:hypothetical protein